MAEKISEGGRWYWDDRLNRLAFRSRNPTVVMARSNANISRGASQTGLPVSRDEVDIVFKENPDTLEKMRFKRRYMRRAAAVDPEEGVTLQDCKDVVIFMANPHHFSEQFMNYFHTKSVDKFLRALIVYFQFYLQTWERMLIYREQAKRCLRHPNVDKTEAMLSKDLQDLRSVVAREYCTVIMGYEDLRRYHHLGGGENIISATDKDRRLSEMLIRMSTRVVWVAMYKKNLSLIDHEMNRMFRSPFFCTTLAAKTAKIHQSMTKEEIRLLYGNSNQLVSKLNQKTPLIGEMIHEPHDYRIQGVNLHTYEPTSKRLKYLEMLYGAPEHELGELEYPVGILGMPRKYFEVNLTFKSRTRFALNRVGVHFMIPPPEEDAPEIIDTSKAAFPMMPTTDPPHPLTEKADKDRLIQKGIWLSVLQQKRTNRTSSIGSRVSRLSTAVSTVSGDEALSIPDHTS